MRKKAHSWDFNGFYAKQRGERGNGQLSLATSVVDGHTEQQQQLKAAVWTPGWIELWIIESSANFIHRSLKLASKGFLRFLTLCMYLYTRAKNWMHHQKPFNVSTRLLACSLALSPTAVLRFSSFNSDTVRCAARRLYLDMNENVKWCDAGAALLLTILTNSTQYG